ncbi:MAG: hypothetical protein R2826_09245 [Thermoleophilia bacterium]
MTSFESNDIHALRRANPRQSPGFEGRLREAEARCAQVIAREEALTDAPDAYGAVRPGRSGARWGRWSRSRRFVALAAAAAAVVVAAVTVATVWPHAGGMGVADAYAAVKKAAAVTAASTQQSGTAVVRASQGGVARFAQTARWHDGDLHVTNDTGTQAVSEWLLVDGHLYFHIPQGWEGPNTYPKGWNEQYLAPTRLDLTGGSLQRITGGMQGVTTASGDDGATVYRGTVAAGVLAARHELRDGRSELVFPFGFIPEDDAPKADAPLDVTLTVGDDGLVRELTASWGAGESAWSYSIAYSDLGSTAPVAAPASTLPTPFATETPEAQ